jgi:hypothetical protein
MSNLYSTAIRDINGNEISNVGPPNIGRVAGTFDSSLNTTIVNGSINYTYGSTEYLVNYITGLPNGGYSGQLLVKNSDNNLDVSWNSSIPIPYYNDINDWKNGGYYGFIKNKNHILTDTIYTYERVGGSLFGFGSTKLQNTVNYGAGATIISSSGIGSNKSILHSNLEAFEISNIAFHGSYSTSISPSVDYLITISDTGTAAANAGTTSIRNCYFCKANIACIRIGQTDTEHHNELIQLNQCHFENTPAGIKIINEQAITLEFNMCSFLGVTTGIMATHGGNFTLNNPVLLSPNSTLLGCLDQGINNATFTINDFKFDNAVAGTARLIDVSGGVQGARLSCLVNGGQVAGLDYVAQNISNNNGWLTRIREGHHLVMTNVFNLQSGMFAWLPSTVFEVANYTVVGCELPNIDPIVLLNSGAATTSGMVSLRTVGCFHIASGQIDDRIITVRKEANGLITVLRNSVV